VSIESWLVLALAPELNAAAVGRLLEHFGDADAIRAASRSELLATGLSAACAERINTPDDSAVGACAAWLEHPDHHLLTWAADDYPPLLKEIANPPVTLFVHGRIDTLHLPQIAIVGSRNATPGGCETAERFAHYLAGNGFCITSGLALGIDAAAHAGALSAEGRTIAICGTGLDAIYPEIHRDLAGSISHAGALVSEFPPGTPPRRANFPQRNRIISGLSIGTLVVEAGLRSGALITARNAAEQGREVFAVPGSIHNPLSKGCHSLIRQGAKLVETGRDIVDELGGLLGSMGDANPASTVIDTARQVLELDSEYHELLSAMGWDPVSVDMLVERTRLTTDQVSSMLLLLELDGRIQPLAGGRYQRSKQSLPR